MIYVIDSDAVMRKCIVKACREFGEVAEFSDAVTAMNEGFATSVQDVNLIFMEILLTGPDGFTLLNELMSYADTAKIPVVVVSELTLNGLDLSRYGVVGVLNKSTMTPEEVRKYAAQYVR